MCRLRRCLAKLRYARALKRLSVGPRFNWHDMEPGTLRSRMVGLQADSPEFQLGGEVFRILGGSIHYFRVPREYWRDRLLKMKACGLNTLTTYVPWNLHEPERGTFNFKGNLDLEAYIKLAGELGLWVILRPGPYICAEWDLGGLPSWLYRDPAMQLRSTYKGFTQAVDAFFSQLLPRVVPLQYKKGGPIIAVQVENEYGSFAVDTEYMPYMKEALLSRGIEELLMTSDNVDGLKKGNVEGALATINLQKLRDLHLSHLDSSQPQKPKMVMEFWSGWFDTWGDLHHVFTAEDMASVVTEILQKGLSINLYMFHGGTNFGFMNGALEMHSYKADVTSYGKVFLYPADYDAPLSESGDYTAKYLLLREVFSKYHGESLPDVPALFPKMSYDASTVYQYMPLWEALQLADEPFKSESPVNMENLPVNNGNGQSYGYTLYETTIPSGGTLHSNDKVRDRALVFVDSSFIGVLKYKHLELAVPEGKPFRSESPVNMENLPVNNGNGQSYGYTLYETTIPSGGTLHSNDKPFKSESPVNMENLPVNNGNGQSYGYTLYETTIPSGGTLHSNDKVRDRALVSYPSHCLLPSCNSPCKYGHFSSTSRDVLSNLSVT
ncbi:UNVERIFIED_CONTAM: hypothetical protein FKN15_012991 [Acipenser sinensis]